MFCYLIRHGKDDETLRGGWSLSGLTEEGISQVKNLTGYINENKNKLKIARLFSSDLPRAIQTAQPISEILNLEIELMPEFRETNNGVLADMSNKIADEKYSGLYWNTLDWDEAYPQGESPRIFYERIKTAWEQFSGMISKSGENVILVTHGGVINVIHSLVDGRPFSNKGKTERIAHAVMLPLGFNDGVWRRL